MAQRMTFLECLFEGVMYEDFVDDEPDSDVIPEDEARIERELYGEVNVDLDE